MAIDEGRASLRDRFFRLGIVQVLQDRPVRVVTLVVLVVMLGFGIVAPILPLYARSFGVGYEAAGLLVSAFAFTRLFFDLVAGPLVDRFGERRVASTGLVIVGVSSVLTGLAPTFPLAVLFRGAGGAGSSILFASLFSYMLKVVPKERMGRTMSVFYGAFNIGVVAGAPVGGFIAARWGLRAPLFGYAALLFVSGVLYMAFVPDPPRSAQADEVPAGEGSMVRRARERMAGLLRIPGFITALVLNLAYLWMVAAVFDTLVPLFGKEGLDMSTGAIGFAFSAALLTELIVLYPAGVASDHRGRKAVLAPSFAGLAVMTVVLGFAGSAMVYVLLMGLLGVASGYAGVPPAAVLADVVPPESSGTGVGMFRFCGDLGFVFGPLVAGVATNAFGFRGAFALSAIPTVIALLVVLRTPETLRRPAAPAA